MKKIRRHACGIDIGSKKVFVSAEGREVRSFGTFTCDFLELKNYLLDQEVETVAMEATGVYWVILYDILKEAGLDVWLVDGRQTRQVPGRKTDVKDCQWIQQLHSYGLLNRCYVATGKIKELRSYMRLREDHLRSASMHVNHLQKSLIEMNIRLPEVLSQVHGKSGMAIIEAILSGCRDPHELLSLCHTSIKKNKSELVLKALEGHYTESGLFSLRQAHEAYHFYKCQIAACDKQIELLLKEISKDKPAPPGGSAGRRKAIRHNRPNIDHLGEQMLKIFEGRDATRLSGITDYNWLQLFSEIGSDLSRWPTEKHFTSWLGLAPGQKNSGKRNRNVKRGKPNAGQIFRTTAQSLLNSKNLALGAFARRMRGRKGPALAIKATARKLAVQYWRLMVKGVDYVEQGIEYYEKIRTMQKHKHLQRLAIELHMDIIPLEKNTS